MVVLAILGRHSCNSGQDFYNLRTAFLSYPDKTPEPRMNCLEVQTGLAAGVILLSIFWSLRIPNTEEH